MKDLCVWPCQSGIAKICVMSEINNSVLTTKGKFFISTSTKTRTSMLPKNYSKKEKSMNTLSKKLLMISLLTAVAVGSVYAGKRKGNQESIIGSWNVNLFLSNGVGAEEEETQSEETNENGVPILGVMKFDRNGTLVADGLTPFFINASTQENGTPLSNGFDTTISIGTWRRISKKLFAISISTVVQGFDMAAKENEVLGNVRIRTRAIIKLKKCGRIAQIFNVTSQAFGPRDICFERPLKIRFPRLNGKLCKQCRPKKVVKGHKQ